MAPIASHAVIALEHLRAEIEEALRSGVNSDTMRGWIRRIDDALALHNSLSSAERYALSTLLDGPRPKKRFHSVTLRTWEERGLVALSSDAVELTDTGRSILDRERGQ